jgi:hypothetical protein
MTDQFFASVGGIRAQTLDLYVGQHGPWYVDAVLDDSGQLAGVVDVIIGSLRLVGTVVPGSSDFVLQRSCRVVAGANGWGKVLDPKSYYSPNGISPIEIARDAARECGETLGDLEFAPDPVGAQYIRRRGPASCVMDRLFFGRAWWVDEQGITQGGERPTRTPEPESYQIDTYSPLQRTAMISLDDPAALWVGSVLTQRLSSPQTIRDLEVHVTRDKCRVKAYTGGDAGDISRIDRALESILRQRETNKLTGVYRFRVFHDLEDGSANLQAVRPGLLAGLPDVLPVTKFAGVAKSLSKLADGDIVGVAFLDGDTNAPIIVAYPHGDPSKTAGVARMGDVVMSGGYGTVVTFSIGPLEGEFAVPAMCVGEPSGLVPVVVAGLPYLVKFSHIENIPLDPTTIIPPLPIPPTPLECDGTLAGYIATASEQEIE